MLNDVRYAVRMLLKTPGFTAVAVFTLALGIGANTAIFSLIDTVLLKMLPVKNPEQLVLLHTVDAQGNSSSIFSYPLYQRLRDHNDVFSGIFVASSPRLSLSMEGQASPVIGELVSGNYFSVLEVHPILGRALTIEDDRIPGAHPVAVISHIFWKNRFELSPSVVGKAITLNGASFTIIGVTPPEFFGETVGRMPEVWIPMMMQSQVMPGRSYLNADDVRWLHMMARIKLGVVEKQVRANLNVILRQYLSEIAGETKDAQRQREILNQRIEPTPGSKGISELRQQFSQPLLVLMAVVGLVLLISCANVANLLLARATVRQKEIAIRLAMGAGRLRLVRQLLIESVSLATLGGVVALLLAYWGTNFPLTLMSHAETPVSLDLHPDVRIFGFTGAISLIASFVFGLAPAFLATRVDLAPALKENPGTVGGSGSGSGLGRVLVIAQVAASLVVLIGAGLFVRSLQKLGKLDAGFDRENVLVLGIDPEASGYDNAQLGSLYRRLLERASTLPGVHSAALSDNGLFDGSSWTRCCVSVEGHAPGQDESRAINADLVTPGFFATVGMSLLQGRDFGQQDSESTTKVGVINETLWRYYFPNDSPIGKRFSLGDSQETRTIEIVGVAKDAKHNSLREETPRFLYLPYSQNTYGSLHFLAVRTLGDPVRMINIARRELQTVDKKLPITQVKTLTQQVDETFAQERLIAASSSIFGLLSLLLASIGLYGLMSYTVCRRVREVGIRMALGARRRDVLRLIVGQGMILTLTGVGIGLAGAFALTRVLTSLLYGVTTTDPTTFIGISLLLTGVALLACYIPARRATKVDPIVALRYE